MSNRRPFTRSRLDPHHSRRDVLFFMIVGRFRQSKERHEDFRDPKASLIELGPLLVGTVGRNEGRLHVVDVGRKNSRDLLALLFGDFNRHGQPQRVRLLKL